MGSNTLRGGVKSYGAMSLVGNWTEDRVAPDFGGLRPAAETEKQVRDMAGSYRCCCCWEARRVTTTHPPTPTPTTIIIILRSDREEPAGVWRVPAGKDGAAQGRGGGGGGDGGSGSG